MTRTEKLMVRVNHELVLDAGTCRASQSRNGSECVIRPPKIPLFRQVLTYLREKVDPAKRPSGSLAGREGIAAAALVLRWGSYLCVLLDRGKPLWPEIDTPGTSRISNSEMARINIEASAALEEWIDLYRSDPGGRLYEDLVNRAVAYLPMPQRTSKLKMTEFAVLAYPEMALRLVAAVEESNASRLERARAEVERRPTRVFANALVNTAWRNGPVEDIHAGRFRGYPLDQRRVSPREEREVLSSVSERLALGMRVCQQFSLEPPPRKWPDQVLPYGLANLMMITPSGWTLTEVSREVRLPT